MNPLPVTDADLHAYVDGLMPATRRQEFEQALARDAALAQRAAQYRQQSVALRDALDPWLEESIPARLLQAAAPPKAERRARYAWPSLAAAATLVLGIGTGWLVRDALLERAGTPTTLPRQMAFQHALYAADVNRPVEVWAAEEKRLVTWLSKRLGFELHAPDLNTAGFGLVGGRLVAGNEKPTAMFMYENAEKKRLSLQVRKLAEGTPESAFRYSTEDGVGVYYWIDDDCAYALSGQLERGQMLAIGRLVYAQLTAAESAHNRPK